ncbi:hypothetical protein FJZ17_03200 [Candidatus Pacearchaeota archaeon]|nr:hypothetical protein [Candidatus Pacearchaeota archaeon]
MKKSRLGIVAGLAGMLTVLGTGCETTSGYANYNSAIGTQAWADLATDPGARLLLQNEANRQRMAAIDDFTKREADRVIEEMRRQQAQQARPVQVATYTPRTPTPIQPQVQPPLRPVQNTIEVSSREILPSSARRLEQIHFTEKMNELKAKSRTNNDFGDYCYLAVDLDEDREISPLEIANTNLNEYRRDQRVYLVTHLGQKNPDTRVRVALFRITPAQKGIRMSSEELPTFTSLSGNGDNSVQLDLARIEPGEFLIDFIVDYKSRLHKYFTLH